MFGLFNHPVSREIYLVTFFCLPPFSLPGDVQYCDIRALCDPSNDLLDLVHFFSPQRREVRRRTRKQQLETLRLSGISNQHPADGDE